MIEKAVKPSYLTFYMVRFFSDCHEWSDKAMLIDELK